MHAGRCPALWRAAAAVLAAWALDARAQHETPLVVSPPGERVQLRVGQRRGFSAVMAEPGTQFTWSLDGAPKGKGTQFELRPTAAFVGTHEVSVTAVAPSMAARHTWVVSVTAVGPPTIVRAVPDAATLQAPAGEPIAFELHADPAALTDAVTVRWSLDGVAVGEGPRLTVRAPASGSQRLRAVAASEYGGAAVREWQIVASADAKTVTTPPPPTEADVPLDPELVEIVRRAVPGQPPPVIGTPKQEASPPVAAVVKKETPPPPKIEQPVPPKKAPEQPPPSVVAAVKKEVPPPGKVEEPAPPKRAPEQPPPTVVAAVKKEVPPPEKVEEPAPPKKVPEQPPPTVVAALKKEAPPPAKTKAPAELPAPVEKRVPERIAAKPAPPPTIPPPPRAPQPPPPPAATGVTEDDVRALMFRYEQAWRTRNAAELRRIGHVETDAQEQALVKYFESTNDLEVAVHVLELHAEGGRGIVRFTRRDHFRDPAGREVSKESPPIEKTIVRTPDGVRFAPRS